MTLKIDIKDQKILSLLDNNSRLSNSQIAKKVRLSKPTVEYRINRLEKNKVIFQYYTIINFTKLGYSQYKIYFKFQNTNLETEQKIIDYWVQTNNSAWVAKIRGRWDLAVSLLAKSNFEFGRNLNDFMNRFSQYILGKEVLLTEYSPIYAREYLTDSKPSEFIYGTNNEEYELDKIDEKIITALSVNARIHITELSKQLKLSRDIINYRMKKLIKDKIIIKYRCELNLSIIGIKQYKLILRTKCFSEENERKVKTYVKQHKKAVQLLKLIGSWDLEIEWEVANEDECYQVINEFRNFFSDIIREYDIIHIIKVYKYNYFPFISG